MSFNPLQNKGYFRAAALCSKSEQNSFKIKNKLLIWGLSEKEAISVLERLKEKKFIDENRYTESFVFDKFKFNKWGKTKIAYQLRHEQISETLIESSICNIKENDYRNTLLKLIMAKNESLKEPDLYKRRAKLFRFAQSRGFESEIVYSVTEEVINRTLAS